MNKLIIPIIIIVIIAAGIGVYFVLQKSAFSEPSTGKCGNGNDRFGLHAIWDRTQDAKNLGITLGH